MTVFGLFEIALSKRRAKNFGRAILVFSDFLFKHVREKRKKKREKGKKKRKEGKGVSKQACAGCCLRGPNPKQRHRTAKKRRRKWHLIFRNSYWTCLPFSPASRWAFSLFSFPEILFKRSILKRRKSFQAFLEKTSRCCLRRCTSRAATSTWRAQLRSGHSLARHS